ncbi:MAG: class I SAM-dependent methyltransferase [Nannocystaceae bacterium]
MARERLTPDELLLRGTVDHYEDAPLYDFEYFERSDDLDWYLALASRLADPLAREGRSLRILELGAGTGRITLPLLAAGHTITALDRMAPMLEHLGRKLGPEHERGRLSTVLADMTALPLEPESFDLVIAPFNALQHLYRWEELLACFREAWRVLAPGGTFAFDVLLPDLEWLHWDPDERHSVTYFTHPVTREPMVYSTNHTYDPATQVCHIRIFYDDAPKRPRPFKPPPRPRRLVHLAHRQIFPEELRALTAWAGFHLDELSGEFAGLALSRDVQSQVVRCRK